MIPKMLVAALLATLAPARALAQAPDSVELIRLEGVWNEAHRRADTTALARLWADDIVITVPEMPVLSRAQAMTFWRSGRSNIIRYETTDIRIRVYGDAAVVTGRLTRERNFNGQTVADSWRFTKTYVRRAGAWCVVAYQASEAGG